MRTRKIAPETSWPLLRLTIAFKNPIWNIYGSKYLVTHHFGNFHDVIWNILVKAQCNTTTESSEFQKLCSYCWIPKSLTSMFEIENGPSFGNAKVHSQRREYKLNKICKYSPPEKCDIGRLVEGTCTDCSWKSSSRLNKWAYQNLISMFTKINMS